MLNNSSEYLCVSLSEDILKVVQVKGKGASARVSHAAVRDVKGVTEEDLPKLIQSALNGFTVKGTTHVCMIPPSMTTTKNIEIPSTNAEEIKSIVNLQAGRHTPFSREEIQVSFVNFGVYKDNYTKVLLVITNRNVLKKQLDLFEKAGLKIKKVFYAPEGTAALYTESLNLKSDTTPIAIVDVAKQSTNFIIALRGAVITARNIPVGKQDLEQGGPAKLIDELKRTIQSYQSEDIDQLPANYIVTGTDEVSQKLQAALEEQLKVSVKTASYIDFVKASKDVLALLANDFAEGSLLDVIAPCAMAHQNQVDLLPEEIKLQKSIEDQGKEVFKTAILAFTILVLVAAGLGAKIYFRNTYLSNLRSDYQDDREQVMVLERLSNKTQIIKDYLTSRMVSLDTIQELYENIPEEVYLSSILMDEKGNVSIQGISDIASIVFNLGTALKESEQFKSVNIKSTTAKKDRGKDVSAFEITLKLMSADDEEEEKAAEAQGE